MFAVIFVIDVTNSQSQIGKLREDLLDERDLDIIKNRGYRNTSFTSPSDSRCLVVATNSGCTRWKEKDCRNAKSIEVYSPDCVSLNSRRVKNCQVRTELAPAENLMSVCGIKWTRECQGPCFNCPETCRAQFEKTCWRNQQVKTSVNIISINGLDVYTEKEYLETSYSCSQDKVAEVCAPNNCRFIQSAEECVYQNDTNIVNLSTRTCNLCTVQVHNQNTIEEGCSEELKQDCREEYPFSWVKLCSYDDKMKGEDLTHMIFPELKEETEMENVMAEFAALYSSSLDPVNNLIINSLKKINVKDIDSDTVVVIPTSSIKEENKSLDIHQETNEGKAHMSVEVSVKYDFTEDQPTHNSTVDNQTQSSGALVKSLSASVTGAETKGSVDSGDNSEDHDNKSSENEDNSEDHDDKSSDYEDLYSLLFEEPGSSSTTVSGGSVTIDSPFATVRSPTRTPSSRNGDALPPPPVDNVYFDPFLAILNDNERNEISTIDRTTSVSPQPSFRFNTMTSSPLPTQTTTTTTTTATTTTSTTTPTAVSTTGSEESGTTKKKLSPAELVKLCFLNNIGCDFNYEEANLATATLATTLPPPSTSTSSTALEEKSKEYELSPEEKVRLCFQFSICDESELQEYAKSQQTQNRVTQEKAVEISAETTTTRRPATVTTDADKYKEIKARAAACFWQNIC